MPRRERELLETQIRSILEHQGRLYDLVHAVVEECYRRGELEYKRQEWQVVALYLTLAEKAAKAL